jgi:hypothetical protein
MRVFRERIEIGEKEIFFALTATELKLLTCSFSSSLSFKGPTKAEHLEAASELDQGLDVAHGKAFFDVDDLERAQLSSWDDTTPQRRPEGRSHELFKAQTGNELGQVRSDGSDELSKLCCVEVAERGAVSVEEEQRAHRLGALLGPGDDPGCADNRLATRRTTGAPFLRFGDLFFKVEEEPLVEWRSVARAAEVAEGLADRRDGVSSPDHVTTHSHDQDRHEHLVGDVRELEGQGRGRGAA